MIAQIRGTVLAKNDSFAVVDVSGLGYKVFASEDFLAKIHENEETSFFTHLVVREDALDLYGFESMPERNFFEKLIGISGIGPKGALGILNVATLETLEQSIISEDSGYLTKVSGIGKKTANKIILELKDKIEVTQKSADGSPLQRPDGASSEAIDALIALGYSGKEAREALGNVSKETTDTSDKIREALKSLGRN